MDTNQTAQAVERDEAAALALGFLPSDDVPTTPTSPVANDIPPAESARRHSETKRVGSKSPVAPVPIVQSRVVPSPRAQAEVVNGELKQMQLSERNEQTPRSGRFSPRSPSASPSPIFLSASDPLGQHGSPGQWTLEPLPATKHRLPVMNSWDVDPRLEASASALHLRAGMSSPHMGSPRTGSPRMASPAPSSPRNRSPSPTRISPSQAEPLISVYGSDYSARVRPPAVPSRTVTLVPHSSIHEYSKLEVFMQGPELPSSYEVHKKSTLTTMCCSEEEMLELERERAARLKEERRLRREQLRELRERELEQDGDAHFMTPLDRFNPNYDKERQEAITKRTSQLDLMVDVKAHEPAPKDATHVRDLMTEDSSGSISNKKQRKREKARLKKLALERIKRMRSKLMATRALEEKDKHIDVAQLERASHLPKVSRSVFGRMVRTSAIKGPGL